MIINNEKRKVKSSESWGLERAVAKELREKRAERRTLLKGIYQTFLRYIQRLNYYRAAQSKLQERCLLGRSRGESSV